MKKLILGLLVMSFSTTVFAKDWMGELLEYSEKLDTASTISIEARALRDIYTSVAACSFDVMLVAASLSADSMPVANVLSEGLANVLDEDYETVTAEKVLSLRSALDLGRGSLGGAGVGVVEGVEYIFLWLVGEEDRSFEAVKKVYASSFKSAEKLFASQGVCMMSIAKFLIATNELTQRRPEDFNDSSFSEIGVMP